MNNKKTVLILAPHQDDELILCGAFLNGLAEQDHRIYIVFMTNGDYEEEIGRVRLSEALKALKTYGLPEKQVIFMGYANEYDARDPHIYNAAKGQIVRSQFGNCETYGLDSHPEYCFEKYGIHHSYCRENLVQDLIEIMQEIRPDIIFSTDAEIHPDHKANSLFLDEVLGKILQAERDFFPVVLKKPEYATSWFNPIDYSKHNNKASVLCSKSKVNGETTDFYNPYLRWKHRTRLPVDLTAQNPIKKENSLWKGLDQYNSQDAASHYERMLNSDVVFWARRTDSLTYRADIETSSGNGAFLNDFKLFDSDDVSRMPYDAWKIGASIWHPENTDLLPYITINWKEKKKIATIIIYQEFCPESEILESHILLEDGQTLTVGKLRKRKPTVVFLDSIFISGFTFVIDRCSNLETVPGISEIEVYEEKPVSYSYIKILVNDNFIYKYIVKNGNRNRISVYLIDTLGFSHYAELNQMDISITDLYGRGLKLENYIDSYGNLCKELKQDIRLHVSLKVHPQLSDTVLFLRDQKKEKKYWKLISLLIKMNIPLTDIREMESSIGFDKLNYIRRFYQVARVKRQFKLCAYLRLFYFYYQMGCQKRKLLTDYQKSEGEAFLLLGESMPGCSEYIKEYIHGKQSSIVTIADKKIFFIGTPSHGNIGDHVISFATMNYLHVVLSDAPVIEISIKEFPYMLGILEKIVKEKDLLILQGGGNMGNIYWTNERIRREVIKRFPDNRIIIFPETIYYENTIYGSTDLMVSKRIYAKANHLTICARERVSYETMKALYKHADVILTPDIVCSFHFCALKSENKIAKLFFRKDKEQCIDDQMRNAIEKVLIEKNFHYEYSDMLYQSRGYIGKANRKYLVEGKVREISESALIITDRLHVMILSVLTGTPCIVFFGYNHKIESTYRTWFSGIPYLALVNDIAQLTDNMDKVIEAAKRRGKLPDWNDAFKPLEKVLKEAWM